VVVVVVVVVSVAASEGIHVAAVVASVEDGVGSEEVIEVVLAEAIVVGMVQAVVESDTNQAVSVELVQHRTMRLQDRVA